MQVVALLCTLRNSSIDMEARVDVSVRVVYHVRGTQLSATTLKINYNNLSNEHKLVRFARKEASDSSNAQNTIHVRLKREWKKKYGKCVGLLW